MNSKNKMSNKILTNEQEKVVKKFIIDSMRKVYTDQGVRPGDDFERASNIIADKIIKNVQNELSQTQGRSFKKTKKK